MSEPVVSRIVRCPQCGQPAKATKDNPARPFCSRRCKLIDLGKWFEEDNRIPGEPEGHIDEDH